MGGELIIINFNRESNNTIFYNKVGEIIKIINKKTYLGSAYVDNNDDLHVFHTTNFGSCISKFIINKDFSISNDEQVYCVGNNSSHIFNTSVAKANDKYYMAYEIADNNGSHFYTKFLSSENLKEWKSMGISFRKGIYTACPTIRYHNNEFYLFFLDNFYDKNNENKLTFVTRVAKGVILDELVMNKLIVLDPRDLTISEGVNNSDFDFVEYKGKIIITYAVGNQRSYVRLKVTEFIGSKDDFFKQLNNLEEELQYAN